MKSSLLDIFAKRRSVYNLTDKSSLTDTQLATLLEKAVMDTPSPFNCQSSRAIMLIGESHKKFWNITLEILKPLVGNNFTQTNEKINTSFLSGYGTILFFEDTPTVEALMEKFPAYRDKFPEFSIQSNAMLQYSMWCLLTEAGMGATLQHYNPLVDEKISKEFNIPSSWKLIAQMPFGIGVKEPGEKTFIPIKERIRIIK